MSIDIPNFRIVRQLGTGQGSTLLHVVCSQTGKHYTLKKVKVRTPEDMKLIEQLKTEYNVGSAVDHPVVRKVFELRQVRRRLRVAAGLLFMEYVDGVSMASPEFGEDMSALLAYIRRGAEGLAALHRAGFVHADLKPGNLLVTPDGEVKLIDFGQCSLIREAKERVQGTIHYMAPEQSSCDVLDARTDVWGLGATLHRILTGKPIATDMNQNVSLHATSLIGKRVKADEQPALAGVPTCVVRLVEACCQREPAKRLPDMKAIIDRIDIARAILARSADKPEAAAVHGEAESGAAD